MQDYPASSLLATEVLRADSVTLPECRIIQNLVYLHGKNPSSHIVVLGLLPRGSWHDPQDMFKLPSDFSRAITAVNKELERFAFSNQRMHFAECTRAFVQSGSVSLSTCMLPCSCIWYMCAQWACQIISQAVCYYCVTRIMFNFSAPCWSMVDFDCAQRHWVWCSAFAESATVLYCCSCPQSWCQMLYTPMQLVWHYWRSAYFLLWSCMAEDRGDKPYVCVS